MRFDSITFDISGEVLSLGLRGAYLAIGHLRNRESDDAFAEYRSERLSSIRQALSPEALATDPILQGFRDLHARVGRTSKKIVASPENLLTMLLDTGTLPTINLIVDIYNLVSVKTHLALGAHDLQAVAGNVHLRLTTGAETFWPLGASKSKPIGPGEYSYIDDDNDVICRLEVRQVEKTKVTTATSECFYIVQGNAATTPEYIQAAVDELVELTRRFCGGEGRILYPIERPLPELAQSAP